MRVVVLICSVFLTLAALSPVPAPALPAESALAIVHKTIARDKVLQRRRRAFDYNLRVVKQKLTADRQVRSATESKFVVRSDERPDYGTRSDPEGGRNLSKPDREEPFELLKVIDHFTYTLEGTEPVNGVSCYRIRFHPKPDMPYHNREEKVINAVGGHLWVSQADYSLMQNEGILERPVSVAWGFATVRELEFRYESQPLPNGDFGPQRVTYRYRVTIPFGQIHERCIRTMSNYRKGA